MYAKFSWLPSAGFVWSLQAHGKQACINNAFSCTKIFLHSLFLWHLGYKYILSLNIDIIVSTAILIFQDFGPVVILWNAPTILISSLAISVWYLGQYTRCIPSCWAKNLKSITSDLKSSTCVGYSSLFWGYSVPSMISLSSPFLHLPNIFSLFLALTLLSQCENL